MGWIMDLGKLAFGMWAFKAHRGLSKPIMGYFLSEKWPPSFCKPWMANYVAAGAFFFQKNDPHISGSPERPPTLPQALFFFIKMTPIFLEAMNG